MSMFEFEKVQTPKD